MFYYSHKIPDQRPTKNIKSEMSTFLDKLKNLMIIYCARMNFVCIPLIS